MKNEPKMKIESPSLKTITRLNKEIDYTKDMPKKFYCKSCEHFFDDVITNRENHGGSEDVCPQCGSIHYEENPYI